MNFKIFVKLFILMVVLTSCGKMDNLTAFSKRKYLKNFPKQKHTEKIVYDKEEYALDEPVLLSGLDENLENYIQKKTKTILPQPDSICKLNGCSRVTEKNSLNQFYSYCYNHKCFIDNCNILKKKKNSKVYNDHCLYHMNKENVTKAKTEEEERLFKKIFYDQDWHIVESLNSASYYGFVTYDEKKDNYIQKDYYLSGQLQMKGEYKSIEPEIKHGKFIFYKEDGSVESKAKYRGGYRIRSRDFVSILQIIAVLIFLAVGLAITLGFIGAAVNMLFIARATDGMYWLVLCLLAGAAVTVIGVGRIYVDNEYGEILQRY